MASRSTSRSRTGQHGERDRRARHRAMKSALDNLVKAHKRVQHHLPQPDLLRRRQQEGRHVGATPRRAARRRNCAPLSPPSSWPLGLAHESDVGITPVRRLAGAQQRRQAAVAAGAHPTTSPPSSLRRQIDRRTRRLLRIFRDAGGGNLRQSTSAERHPGQPRWGAAAALTISAGSNDTLTFFHRRAGRLRDPGRRHLRVRRTPPLPRSSRAQWRDRPVVGGIGARSSRAGGILGIVIDQLRRGTAPRFGAGRQRAAGPVRQRHRHRRCRRRGNHQRCRRHRAGKADLQSGGPRLGQLAVDRCADPNDLTRLRHACCAIR